MKALDQSVFKDQPLHFKYAMVSSHGTALLTERHPDEAAGYGDFGRVRTLGDGYDAGFWDDCHLPNWVQPYIKRAYE